MRYCKEHKVSYPDNSRCCDCQGSESFLDYLEDKKLAEKMKK